MQQSLDFLHCIARVLLDPFRRELLGQFIIDARPNFVADVWTDWAQGRGETERRSSIHGVLHASPESIRQETAGILEVAKATHAPEALGRVGAYLGLVPATVRQSLRRAEDPHGSTVPAGKRFDKPEDLLPLLPLRIPSSFVGDRPLPKIGREVTELLDINLLGETWKARSEGSDALPVVLEICQNPAAKARLRQAEGELARVQQQGKVSGFVALLGAYLAHDPPCLEYEYVKGGDLAALGQALHRGQTPATTDAIHRLVLRLAKSMGIFHRLRPPIAHGDLLPANIVVQQQDDRRVSLRIARLGLGGVMAQLALEQSRGDGQRFLYTAQRGAHSPLYASPEKSRGQGISPRDDVHAIGVIWYQMLLNDWTKAPPVGASWRQRLQALGMSEPMLDLMQAAFAENATQRPADAAVLAERLDELLKAPAPAVAPTPPEKTKLPTTAAGLRGPMATADDETRLTPAQWFARGQECLAKKDHEGTLWALNKALLGGYDESAVCRLRARVRLERQDFPRAIADLDRLVALRGKDADSYLVRAEAYLAAGDQQSAVADLTQALQINPRSAAVYLARGRLFLAQGDCDRALADFSQALRIEPRNAEAHRNAGAAWRKKGDLEKAGQAYSAAIRLRPDDPTLFFLRGGVCFEQDRPQQAVTDLTDAIGLDSRFADAFHLRGQVFMKYEDLENAMLDFDQTLRLDRKKAAAFRDRARAHLRVGNLKAALADYTQAIAQSPSDAQLYLDRAALFLRQGDKRKAQMDYSRALRRCPDCLEAYAARGKILLERGRFSRAIDDLTKVVSRRPDAVDALVDRGRAYLAKKEFNDAHTDATAALQKQPGHAGALALQAEIERVATNRV